jgi:hypothetical protein
MEIRWRYFRGLGNCLNTNISKFLKMNAYRSRLGVLRRYNYRKIGDGMSHL